MITAALVGGSLYNLTSVPQMPATSIFISAASSGMSGIGNSRISVLLGPTRTAASTWSVMGEQLQDYRHALADTLRWGLDPSSRLSPLSEAPIGMLGSFKKSPEQLLALDQVERWTRARFTLPVDAAILVAEVACALPGCPPL